MVRYVVGAARALLRRLLGIRSPSLEALGKPKGLHPIVLRARALQLENVTTAYCRATPDGVMVVGVYRSGASLTLAYYEDYYDALGAVEALAQEYNVRSYIGAPARKRSYPAGSDGVG